MLADEQFIADHQLDQYSADILIQAPTTVITEVLQQGPLRGRNLSAMATKRLRVVYDNMFWASELKVITENADVKIETESEGNWGEYKGEIPEMIPTVHTVREPQSPPPDHLRSTMSPQDKPVLVPSSNQM